MVELTITRSEALDTYGTLMTEVLLDLIYVDSVELLENEEYEELDEQLRQTLTEPIIIVLPESEKTHLATWAAKGRHKEILQWINAAREDKEVHTWTEKEYATKAALEQKNKELEQKDKESERSIKALKRRNKRLKKQNDELAKLVVKESLKHPKGLKKTFKRVKAVASPMKRKLDEASIQTEEENEMA